ISRTRRTVNERELSEHVAPPERRKMIWTASLQRHQNAHRPAANEKQFPTHLTAAKNRCTGGVAADHSARRERSQRFLLAFAQDFQIANVPRFLGWPRNLSFLQDAVFHPFQRLVKVSENSRAPLLLR